MRPTIIKIQLISSLVAVLLAISSSVVFAQDNNEADETDETSEEESVELEPVVVVGGRVEQNLGDVVGSVSVMTSKDINEQMVTDMSQLFKYEPGIDVTGVNGGAQNFIVRGMGGDRVMMIKDGMRMNEGYGADGANDIIGRGFIDMDTIKQVEVAKGAASSLYGADAMGGIVAFSTKDAADVMAVGKDFYIAVNGNYDGRSDDFGAGVMTAFRTGKWETLLSYRGRWGHETQNYTNDREEADIDSTSVLAKTDYIIDNNKTLTFTYDYYKQTVYHPDNGEDKGTYVGLPGWDITLLERDNEKNNDSYQARYRDNDTGWAIMDNLNVNLYLNKTDQIDNNLLNYLTPPPFGTGGSRDTVKSALFQQETWGLSASASKVMGNGNVAHQLSYGFDWDSSDTNRPRRELRTTSEGEVIMDDQTATFPRNTTERLGIYLQDTIELTEQWSLIPGLRYDYYKMTPKDDEFYDNNIGDARTTPEKISDSNVSWRLGTIYKFTDNFSAYFQYSQGFKVPPYDLAYFYLDHYIFDWSTFSYYGIRTIPANDLVPEESDSYEVGIRGSAGNFSYSLSAYRSDYDNFIEIAYLGTIIDPDTPYGEIPVDVSQYQNIESARISGFEFSFDYYIGNNVSMFLNGEYMDTENKSTGEQLRSVQPFNGTVGVNWFKGNFSTDAMLRWSGDMDKNNPGTITTDSWVTLDLFARYDFNNRLTLSAGILNLFDEEYIQYTSISGLSDDGRDLNRFTQPGRTFSARIKYIF